MPRRTLTDGDRTVWAAFAQHVRALPGVPLPCQAVPDVPPPPAPPAPALPHPPAQPRTAAELAVGAAPGGLDKATWARLRTGKLRPVRTLDLHGQTAQRAFHALHTFLLHAHADRLRCVEVITGRGSGEAGGVLRRELPFWLNQPPLRPLILAMTHPHPANVGSVRLLLRRTR